MNDELKQKIKPIYNELQGYLSQCPPSDKSSYQYNSFYWTQLNDCIEQLNTITQEDYSRFKVTVIPNSHSEGDHIETSEYRAKLNGLIMHLKGKYFPEEADPFGGSPNVVVSQTQNTQITMLMDFQSLIDKSLYGNGLKPEEKTYLEKIKAALPTIKTAAELTGLVIKTAKDLGMDIHTVAKLFGWI